MFAGCDPLPSEILVHLDQPPPGATSTLKMKHPSVRFLESEESRGPGGARNLLVEAATNKWVVNFDDDSRPVGRDFFGQVWESVSTYPEAAVISYSNQPSDWALPYAQIVAIHSGYACVFNRTWFVRVGGFVPLPFAYCMEEVDFGLRVHASGGLIIHQPAIQVVHDMIERPIEKSFQARALANTGLFLFLRYPLVLWPLAALQFLRRVCWLSRICAAAIGAGLLITPRHLWKHRCQRQVQSALRVLSFLHLQRNPIPVRKQSNS